jgi:HSP20 family protein
MDPFEKDHNRRKKNPFDDFGIDEDFFKELFGNDKIRDDIQKMTEEMMKMFSNAESGKPFVRGFNVQFGPDGKPRIEDFGNRSIKSPDGEPAISEEREPLTDIIEGDGEVSVTVEIPGVEKEDINLNVTGDALEITVDNPKRKYHKRLDLPCDVKPKTTKATYKNGILDVVITRKDKKRPGEGYRINVK